MSRLYGRDRTIHRTGHVDVAQDQDGLVTAVWFRCQKLPFVARRPGSDRLSGADMEPPSLEAVVVADDQWERREFKLGPLRVTLEWRRR